MFLTVPGDGLQGFCLIIGTIAPSGVVPLHSHPDLEIFYLISGQIEVLSHTRHASRNRTSEPVVQLIATTVWLGRFFEEAGKPTAPGSPPPVITPVDVERFSRLPPL